MTVLTGLMKFLIIKWHWTELSIVRFCKVLKIFLPHEEEEKEEKRGRGGGGGGMNGKECLELLLNASALDWIPESPVI